MKHPFRHPIWKDLKGLLSTAVFVWLFTNHVAQATVVPTESMTPTILVGDHFFLDKLAFPANYPALVQKFLPQRTIERGNIIAFWSPEDPNLRLVKRVVGIPGDVIEIREGDAYINGQKLDEAYAVHALPRAFRGGSYGPITVLHDEFFMMGDNRDNSRDSRYFGLVERKNLIGKPTFVYWSYESDPYRPGHWTAGEWIRYYTSIATHFATRTRWTRTGTVLR
jgi:signal peptidase I